MDIHIDLHMVALFVGFALAALLFAAWLRFARRVDTGLFALGLGVTFFVASRGEISVSHIETTLLIGLVVSLVLTVVFVLTRANMRKGRLLQQSFRGRSGRANTALQFAQGSRRGQLQDIHERKTVPAPEPETRSIPDDVYYDDEEEEADYYAPRPVQRHSSQNRARRRTGSYVVNPGSVQTARRGRLQQQGGR